MLVVTLPDKKQLSFEQAVTVQQVAEHIGAGLAKAAIAGKVNGCLVDTSCLLEQDSDVSIVTARDQEGLAVIRHSTAHLLAYAVKTLFPQVQVTIGPVIENGFYYDFSSEHHFTQEDLVRIEEKMHELARADFPVHRKPMDRAEAIKFFHDQGEFYKVKIIEDIPETEPLTFYQEGDFVDLCRGPHVPSTGKLQVFKLMKVAGAYWRGDSKNEMLQRIYGTAWADKKSMADYLNQLEEAEKRDHRKLGKALDLFHLQEEGPGMVFWHHKGWAIYQVITDYIRALLRHHDYEEVHTPEILSRTLWERSGHWEKFKEEMFTTASEDHEYAIKPMNCPCHVQIFNHGLRSYRELPVRIAEFGSCHRNEPSGALHGLMRARNFTQDDGHIFCTEDQIQEEVSSFIDLLFTVYRDFGFNNILLKVSTRPDRRVGSDAIWDKAEQALMDALNHKGLQWDLNPGEGAFYGPKIEFSLRDCIGRVWQCGTVQVDFSMPDRLGAEYVAEDSSRKIPVMVHRAVLGSIERFIGILIEHYAGLLPTWLAPVQVVILSITDRQLHYAEQVAQILMNQGFRATVDLRNEKIGFKIREHTLQRIPYLMVLGDREVAEKTITVRMRNGDDLGSMKLTEFIERLQSDIANYGRST